MTLHFTKIRSHLANWRQWEMNPVVVKELRQSVRSWAVTGTLLLFLTVLFIAAVIFCVTQSFDVSANERLGAQIFQIFAVILSGASLLFIPLYIGIRVASERQESNLDLLYISTLTPQRIIRGKFLCGAYVAVLFFSACMPFMTFTNMLRGIDLPSVFFTLLCLFLAVCCAVQVAIFLACLPISKLLKVLVGLAAVITVFPMIGGLNFWTFDMMRRGVGSMMGNGDFWATFLTVCVIALAATLFLYFLSVALISPLSANRALPVRVYMTVIWVIGAVVCLMWAKKAHDARLILPWTIISIILFGLSLAVIVSNQDVLSRRVQRTIPPPGPRRWLAFLYYNGAAGGLLWLALLNILTYGTTYFILKAGYFGSTMTPGDLKPLMLTWGAVSLYGFDYALTGLFLHRTFLRHKSPKLAGILAVIIPGVWAVAPVIFLFFLNQLTTHVLEHTQPGNLFNIFSVNDDSQRGMHLDFAFGWLLVMLLLNGRWFVRQAKSFEPFQRPVPAPPPTAVPPIISTVAN